MLQAAAVPSDPAYVDQWYFSNSGQSGGTPGSDINTAAAWDRTIGSRAVVVAILDSGIDLTHPDLAENIWVNPGEIAGDGIDNDGNGFIDDVNGWDFVDHDSDPTDDYFHGTHMAGLIGAVGNNLTSITGVNWHVSLMPVKVLDFRGDGRINNAAAAIDYVAMMKRDFGVPVIAINASFGGIAFSQTLHNAIESAVAEDLLFVTVAGNGGDDLDATPLYPASEASDRVLTIAATDDKDELALFSSFGQMTVDLAAPGSDICSTTPIVETPGMTRNSLSAETGVLSGTSMSAALVSGAVALLKSHVPDATADEIREAIFQGVDLLESLAATTITGGRLNVAASLAALDQIVNDPPVLQHPGALVVNELELLDVTIGASDPDLPNDELTFSLPGAPEGATIDALTGRLLWTPSEAQGPAHHQFRVRVTDSGALALFNEISFVVEVAEVDVAPVLSAGRSPEIDVDQPLNLSLMVSHSDDPGQAVTVTFNWNDGTPPDEQLLDFNGPFTTTLSQLHVFPSPGRYAVDVTARDEAGNQAFESFVIFVNTVRTITSRTPLTYRDSSNHAVTLRVLGPGEGRVVLPPSGVGNIKLLQLADTTTRSSLIVQSAMGTTTFGGIEIDGNFGRLIAPRVNLAGDLILKGVRYVALGDVQANTRIVIERDSQAAIDLGVILRLGKVEADVIEVAGHIRQFIVTSWATKDSTLHAESIGRLLVLGDRRAGISGNFNSDLILTGRNRGPTLATGLIRGDIDSANWSVDGDIGVIRAFGQIEAFHLAVTGDVASLLFSRATDSWVDVGGRLRVVRGEGWFSGHLQARSFGSLSFTARGAGVDALTGDISATGPGVGIRQLLVRGNWRNAELESRGDVLRIVASRIVGVNILLGISSEKVRPFDEVAASVAFEAQPRLGAVVAIGENPHRSEAAFSDSIIAAWDIGAVWLRSVDYESESVSGVLSHRLGRLVDGSGTTRLAPALGTMVDLREGSFRVLVV